MNLAGLSLEQAPPISTPFRFFLTAPLFLAAAGPLLLWYGPEALSTRWAMPTLVLTHLITLGFLAMVMCGAITQMLPVLAGAPIPHVRAVGSTVHGLLVTGTVLLIAAFLRGGSGLFSAASLALGGGLLVFVGGAIWALVLARARGFFTVGVGAALASVIVTLGLGVTLALGLGGVHPLSDPLALTDLHLTWGIVGWIGLLILGVAYQVIPMFHVTPPYPDLLKRTLVPVVLLMLSFWTLATQLAPNPILTLPPIAVTGAGFCTFAVFTLRLFRRRRRKTPDVAIPFWHLGLAGIGCGAMLWSVAALTDAPLDLPIGVALLLIGAVSIVNGMLYKIVPFLSWFHLQTRQVRSGRVDIRIPNAGNLLPPPMARIQFYLHLAACVLCLAATWLPDALARVAGAALTASALLLAINLARAALGYRRASALFDGRPE